MATDYPDIIGEYAVASNRFELDGLQYVGSFDPKTIGLGERAKLVLHLQNTLNVPLKIQIKPDVPQTGRFRAKPMLEIGSPQIEFSMAEAEVGVLAIPVITTDQAAPGTHQFGLEFKVQHSRNATVIRKPKAKDPLKGLPLDSPVGLNLVSVVGAAYSTQNGRKAKIPLNISNEAAEESVSESLEHSYQKVWDIDMAQSQHNAQVAVNKVRAQILDTLAVEPLFVALYAENQHRFVDTGLPLRIGEAIALGKLLTYTVHLFLSQGNLQDGLLCPIWERAMFNDFPTDDMLQLIRVVGYRHIMRLSVALSFGLVAQSAGKQPWSLEERQGLADYLIEALEEGVPLEIDFLYLPLMLGALHIIHQVRLPDEDVKHTLQLIKQARQARTELFTDEYMQEASKMYDSLLQKVTSQ
jgi:hypothetical protein